MGSWVTYGLGTREPESARLHRACARAGIRSRNRRTGRRDFCRAFTRARTSTRSTPSIEQADRAHQEQRRLDARSSAQQLDLLQELNAQHAASAAGRSRSSKRASNRSSWRTACRWTRPMRSTSRSEPKHIREMYGDRRAGAADADRAAAARARRALRAGLARRGPAVGQPRRPRSEPPPAGARNATSRSARC